MFFSWILEEKLVFCFLYTWFFSNEFCFKKVVFLVLLLRTLYSRLRVSVHVCSCQVLGHDTTSFLQNLGRFMIKAVSYDHLVLSFSSRLLLDYGDWILDVGGVVEVFGCETLFVYDLKYL